MNKDEERAWMASLKKPLRGWGKDWPFPFARKGRFSLQQVVQWRSKKGGPLHIGKIIMVIDAGKYPIYVARDTGVQGKIPQQGFFRDHESYIVEDSKGQRYWPRVGNLKLVEK